MAIAQRLIRLGHDVTIVCAQAEMTPPDDIKLMTLPNKAFLNPDINLQFALELHKMASEAFDLVVGFNKMPHLDVLYCADPPIRRPSTILERLTPRIRKYRQLDLSCFGKESRTRILLLSERQRLQYRQAYQTAPSRMEVLPPTIERSRILAVPDQLKARAGQRRALDVTDSRMLWLYVGRYPFNKGFDRVIRALKDFPDVQCLCVGFEHDTSRHRKLIQQAKHAGVANRLRLLGPREDIPELMAAADLLVHPARKDVTGTVILEALSNGLPVVTTEACGYAGHVTRADAGLVVSDPFQHEKFRLAVEAAQVTATRRTWRKNALEYAGKEDLYSGIDRATLAIAESLDVREGRQSLKSAE